jgi:hypothetical protein
MSRNARGRRADGFPGQGRVLVQRHLGCDVAHARLVLVAGFAIRARERLGSPFDTGALRPAQPIEGIGEVLICADAGLVEYTQGLLGFGMTGDGSTVIPAEGAPLVARQSLALDIDIAHQCLGHGIAVEGGDEDLGEILGLRNAVFV